MYSPEQIIVLIDLDEVLADFGKKFEEDWNQGAGNFPAFHDSDRTTFYIVAEPSIMSTAGGITRVNRILASPGFSEDLKPIKDAMEQLHAMLEMPEIDPYIVTSPNRLSLSNYSDKARWTRRKLGADWLERLIITPAKSLVYGDFLIDDKPDRNDGAIVPFWKHILFRRPHNRAYWNKMPSCDWTDWKEVLLPRLD